MNRTRHPHFNEPPARPAVLETALFPGMLTPAMLDEAATAGVRQLEICCVPHRFAFRDPIYLKEISSRIKAAGMTVSSTHLPFGPEFDPGADDEARRRDAVTGLASAAELSLALGATVMVLHPGVHLDPGSDRRARLRTAVRSIRELLDRLPPTGYVLAVENLLPGYPGESTEEVAAVIDGAADPRVGFCLDTGHARLTGTMASLLHRCGRHLVNVHIHDNAGDADRHLKPGCGDIDWTALDAALDRLGYAGPLTWEIVNENDPAERRRVMTAMQYPVQNRSMSPL